MFSRQRDLTGRPRVRIAMTGGQDTLHHVTPRHALSCRILHAIPCHFLHAIPCHFLHAILCHFFHAISCRILHALSCRILHAISCHILHVISCHFLHAISCHFLHAISCHILHAISMIPASPCPCSPRVQDLGPGPPGVQVHAVPPPHPQEVPQALQVRGLLVDWWSTWCTCW